MNLILSFVQYRISMVFLLIFVGLFLPLRCRGWRLCTGLGGCFVLTGVIEYLQIFDRPSASLMLLGTFAEIIIVQASCILLCRYRDSRALFTGMTAAAYVMTGSVMSMIVRTETGSYPAAILVHILVDGIFLLVYFFYVRRFWNEIFLIWAPEWWVLCSVPALFYLSVFALTQWPADLCRYRANAVGIVFILLLMFNSYRQIFALVAQQKKESEMELSRAFLQTCSDGLRRNAESLRQTEEKISIMRHDLRHMQRLIRAYLDAGDTAQVYQLLDEIGDDLNQTGGNGRGGLFCENMAMNGILAEFAARAESRNVKLEIKASMPETPERINEFEFATVVSNLLENAMNAALGVPEEEERWISLKLYPVKKQFLLEITNTFRGDCNLTLTDGLPVVRPRDGHGYGLRSVQAYVRKWNAGIDCQVEDHVLKITLLT